MTTTLDSSDLLVIRDRERAAALLDTDRCGLLEALIDDPDSASGLARRLGDTRQRVNYHLRALEEMGLIALHEERRKGNCFERVMRAVARRFLLDPGVLGALSPDPAPAGDRSSAAYVIALASRVVREVATAVERAKTQPKRLATASIEVEVRLAHPDSFQSLTSELNDAVARVVAKYHDERAPAGRSFRLLAVMYPRPVDTEAKLAGGGT